MIKPTLAKKYNGQRASKFWMSEKLDGVRAIWTGEEFVSRMGKVFDAPARFKRRMPKRVKLDGELFLDRGQFQKCCGIVRRKNDSWKGIRFVVFDIVEDDECFENRYENLMLLREALPKHVEVLEQIKCRDDAHLDEFETSILSKGGEGVMLKNPSSHYCYGRSADLLKVKRFQDCEAKITGYQAGEGKHEGRLGALICSFAGKVVKVGTGFTDSERENPPSIGEIVTIKFFELTEAGIPRFPVFIAARNYE